MVEHQLSGASHQPRADAVRNRGRLLAAATDVFREEGLEAGVGEIAARAGVGRATVFRNFPSKQALMLALFAHETRRKITEGRALLDDANGRPILIKHAREFVELDRANRGLLESLASDAFLHDPEIADLHTEMLALVGEMIEHDRRLGFVRDDITSTDMLLMMKGVCAIISSPLGSRPATLERCMELLAYAIAP